MNIVLHRKGVGTKAEFLCQDNSWDCEPSARRYFPNSVSALEYAQQHNCGDGVEVVLEFEDGQYNLYIPIGRVPQTRSD